MKFTFKMCLCTLRENYRLRIPSSGWTAKQLNRNRRTDYGALW